MLSSRLNLDLIVDTNIGDKKHSALQKSKSIIINSEQKRKSQIYS